MQPQIPEIAGLDEDQVRTLMNCRGLSQYVSMIEDYRSGKCPFCDPLSPKNKVIFQNASWRMWVNPFPLKHTRLHLIIAHMRHLESPNLTPEHWKDMGEAYKWGRDEFDIQGGTFSTEFEVHGGAFAMRFGSPEFNSGSVLHLHANIIVPDGTGAVQITLAKNREKVAETIQRMHVFEKLLAGTPLDALSDAEKKLVEDRLI